MDTIKIGNKNFMSQDIIAQSAKAPGWFLAIAVFSLINTVLHLFKSDVNFVIGLGITLLVDAIIISARNEGSGPVPAILTVAGIVINLLFVGILFLIWGLSKRGSKTAFIVGMVLYLLDGLLFFLFKDWIGLGFHVFFLIMLWQGFNFLKNKPLAEHLLALQSAAGTVNVPQQALNKPSAP